MIAELRQTQSLTNLVEAIDRWEAIAVNLHSEALKLMVAEHTEFLKQQLERHMVTGSLLPPDLAIQEGR